MNSVDSPVHATSNPLESRSDGPLICPRRSDASACQYFTGSSGASFYSPSPSRCNCRICKYYKHQVNCVPWFTYKHRRHHAFQEDENLVVKSIQNVKYENTWYRLQVSGQTPIRRSKHAAVVVGRRMFIVGGMCSKGILNDVQELQFECSAWREWSVWVPELNFDGPRCAGHSLFFWEKKLLVVGGHIEPFNQLLEVYAFELETRRWKRLNLGGEIPMARIGHTVVQVGSMLIMFGGEDARGQLRNDIHILDLKTLSWLPSSTVGTKPCPRKGQSAVCYASRYLWIFGGRSRTSYLSDLHCLDLRTMEWVATNAKGNVIPRAGHASTIVGHRWYIVGGEYNDKEIIGTLVFDLPTQAWSVVTTVSPNSPLANDGISLVNIQHGGRNYLMTYGGHGFQHSNRVYVMMLPQVFQLQTGFRLVKPSKFRIFFSRLMGGKPPRRKLRRHNSRRSSHATEASLLTDCQIQGSSQEEEATQQNSAVNLVKPRLSDSDLYTGSSQEMIQMLLKNKQDIQNKLEDALQKIVKLEQDFVALGKERRAAHAITTTPTSSQFHDQQPNGAAAEEPMEKLITVVVSSPTF